MKGRKWNTATSREYEAYLETCSTIRSATENGIPHKETAKQKADRKAKLLTDIDAFAAFYFPHLVDAKFGWFHRRAHKQLQGSLGKHVWEWPRSHGKSTFWVIEMMFQHAAGDLRGLVVASANNDKAAGLLADMQAQYEANAIWIYDYGDMRTQAEWRTDYFATTDGVGFWALGRGQSPRGIKKGAKRPNRFIVDDIDDKIIVRNQERVREAKNWILEDLFGCMDIKYGGQLIVIGNRIHPQSILAHIVGDISPEATKDATVNHIKVFMTEDPRPRSHAKDKSKKAVPAWKERYTRRDTDRIRAAIGSRASDREHYHEHHAEGHVFKPDQIQWGKRPQVFDAITAYCDPSKKGTKTADFKAWVVVGRVSNPQQYWIIGVWVRRGSTLSMVKVGFDFMEQFGPLATYRIEAGMAQEENYRDTFAAEADLRDTVDLCKEDHARKGDKHVRIESTLSPLFERKQVYFDEDLKGSPDVEQLQQQLLGFPFGHDDAPDALEGAITNLAKGSRSLRLLRSGRYASAAGRQFQSNSRGRSRGRRRR